MVSLQKINVLVCFAALLNTWQAFDLRQSGRAATNISTALLAGRPGWILTLSPVAMWTHSKGESQFSVLHLPLSFARSHECKGSPNSHFDRDVGVNTPEIKAFLQAYLKPRGTQNTLRPESPINVSIYGLIYLKITTVLCSTQSCTYIFATMFLIKMFF